MDDLPYLVLFRTELPHVQMIVPDPKYGDYGELSRQTAVRIGSRAGSALVAKYNDIQTLFDVFTNMDPDIWSTEVVYDGCTNYATFAAGSDVRHHQKWVRGTIIFTL